MQNKGRRLLEAAVALLREADDKAMNVTVLNKALFYLDLAALRDFGKTVTSNAYVALRAGPVVAHYRIRLVQQLVEQGWAEQEESGNARPVRLVSEPDAAGTLTEEALDLARKVSIWASQMTASNISEFAHQNLGWQSAYQQGQGAGNPPKPINMSLALQQVIEEDPWLEEEATEDDLETLHHAAVGSALPW